MNELNKHIRENEIVCCNCKHLLNMTEAGLGFRCAKKRNDSFPVPIPDLRHTCYDFQKTGLKKEVTKQDVFLAWANLIDIMYDYLQVARGRGGTMGYKVGSYYNRLKEIKSLFENL
jgi:hypothetical protein